MFRSIPFVALGLLTFSGVGVVQAQPKAAPVRSGVPRVESFVHVDVVVPEKGPLVLNVEVHNSSVAQVLNAIAGSGNLNLVTKKGVSGNIAFLSLRNTSPEKSLSILCRATRLECEQKDNIWVVSPPAPVELTVINPPVIDNISYCEVDARVLLSMISTQFDVPIVIRDDVKGTITYIRLADKTPREAVETVALAINAKVTQGENGALIVSNKPGA